jgi:hypothetical protein
MVICWLWLLIFGPCQRLGIGGASSRIYLKISDHVLIFRSRLRGLGLTGFARQQERKQCAAHYSMGVRTAFNNNN